MVTITLRRPYCDSVESVKYGMTPNGKQRCRCRSCGRRHCEDSGSIRLWKVNVEGAEYEVLLGASEFRTQMDVLVLGDRFISRESGA